MTYENIQPSVVLSGPYNHRFISTISATLVIQLKTEQYKTNHFTAG